MIYAGCKEKQVEGTCSRGKFYQSMLQVAMVESTQTVVFFSKFWFGQPLLYDDINVCIYIYIHNLFIS